MNPLTRITNLINLAIEQGKNVLLSIAALFLLNFLSFFLLLVYFGRHDRVIATAFVLIFVWPVLLIVYGILRLRSGITTSEETIRRRREVTLRYFGICTFGVVAALLLVWRYLIGEDPLTTSYSIVLPLTVLGAVLVIIAWYWSKFSNTKLSWRIGKAPIHYLFAATAFVIAVICYIAYDDLKFFTASRPFAGLRIRQTQIGFGVATFVAAFLAFGSLVLGYLRPSDGIEDSALSEAKKLSSKIHNRNLSNHVESPSSHTTREALDRLADRVETTYASLDRLLRSSSVSHNFNTSRLVAERIELIRGRLTSELKDLTKRGNLNLTIGILTTLGAVSALFWGLIATQPNPQEAQAAGLLKHYLPRLSFAIFIEVFSFFFLRLYKNSLEDIKYYHNELTNLDSRLLALQMAVSTQQSDALTPILLGLLSTDRNFVLKSGESTVELEKVKTEQQYLRSLIDTVSKKIPDFGTAEKN